MSISKAKIEANLRPFLLTKINREVLDILTDENFVDIYNDVARDLNTVAELLIERYRKLTDLTNAEDDSLTNYLMQRPIIKVLSVKYHSPSWEDQFWTWLNDDNNNGRVILKTAPTGGVTLDIWYLGDIENVAIDTDDIDLPGNVMPEFVELVKRRILADYGELDINSYEESLIYFSEKARAKNERHLLDGPADVYWFHQSGDTTVYDITDQFVSAGDNVFPDIDGNYVFYT